MKLKKLAIGVGLCVCASVKADSCKMNELVTMPIEELMNLTVSSSNKTATCISQAPSTISTYNYKEIHHLGARTLSDVLTLVAGVQMQTIPNGRQRIWMRGVQADFNNKVALFIDNVPIKDSFGGFAIDEGLPVESIEKVEIIRGPGSALYGSNAFSGVINIFTFQAGKKSSDGNNSEQKLKNTLKLGLGEDNTYLAYGRVEQNIADAVDVNVEGKWLETDGRKPDYNRKGGINTQSNSQELAYAHISMSALGGELLFNGFYNQFDNHRVEKPLPTQNTVVDKNFRLSLSYRHAFSDTFGININAYHTDTQRLEHEITSRTSNKVFISHTNLSGFYSALNYQPHESNKLIAGFEFKREEEPTSGVISKIDHSFKNSTADPAYQDLSLATYSFFLQDTQNIFSSKTQLTVGLRYEVLDLFNNQFNYRLGLTHGFDNGVYAKLLYGTAYRAPSFVEFSRNFIGVELPDVETVDTLEAQIGYQTQKMQVSLTGYRNSYNNVLQRRNSFNSPSRTVEESGNFSNFDHQTVFGTEFEAQITFDKNWKSFLNASWSHAASRDAAQKIPLLADWTVATGFEWSEKIYGGDLVFNNQLVVYGKRKDWQSNLWENSKELRLPNRSSSLTDGFATWNSSLHYKLPIASNKQSLDFDLSAFNILNKTYYTQSLTPPSTHAANPNDRVAFFDTQYQGRQVRFSVSYSW